MRRVSDEVIERLKEEVDLVELVIRSGVALRKSGRDLVGCCPFHDDDTPSLMVTPTKGLWHCMGACQTGGSVIDWVMRVHGVSFRHAVELLRTEEIPTVAPGGVVRTGTIRHLPAPVEAGADDAQVLAQVVGYYHRTLLESPDALAYLAKRKIGTHEVTERFSLGYSDRTLGLRLPAKNRKAGAEIRGRLTSLGVYRTSGHEHLVGSLVIPVTDPGGSVTDLYGRKIRDDLNRDIPRHLYLPGPHKGVWNQEGLASGEVILCESLIDALTLWCFGFTNVTASYGTAGFTPAHHETFARAGVTRCLIAYDHDAAGDQAAQVLAGELTETGIECFRVLPPPGYDINDVAVVAKQPQDALGRLIRHAEWIGKGTGPRRGSSSALTRDVRDDGEIVFDDPMPTVAVAVPLEDVAALPDQVAPEPSPPVSLAPQVSPVPEEREGPRVTRTDDELRIESDGRTWRVRGLAKVKAFDAAKVHVSVADSSGRVHVDTFDLYASRARAAFVREAAAELLAQEPDIKRELGRVLLAVEQDAEAHEDEGALATMSDEERNDALALLCDPDLATQIAADVTAVGVVGEDRNALLCYLACVSRKCERPLGVLVQSSSAAGKSTLADAVLSLCPPEDSVTYSAMTGQSLFYLGRSDLAHKVLAIAEEEGASRATYALKLLQSEGRLSIASAGKDPVTGKLVTHTYEVTGPVALLTTTTSLDVDEELANRLVVLSVKEDAGQTRAIHAAQRRALTLEGLVRRSERRAVIERHHNAQRLLEPLPVVLPDAADLTYPDHTTRARRDHAKYLGLICASALLHQHQRKIATAQVAGGEVRYIEASEQDVALADRLSADLLVRDGSELSVGTRRIYDALVAFSPEAPFTRREAREALGVGDTQLKVHLARLVALEYVAATREGRFVTYELCSALDATTTPIRSGPEVIRSGQTPIRSGPGRRVVGIRSGRTDPPFSQQEGPIDDHAVGLGATRSYPVPDLALVEDAGEVQEALFAHTNGTH